MKKLIALLLVVSSLTFAKQKDFTLPIESVDNQTDKLVFVKDDWQFISEASEYKVFVEKGALGSDQDYVEFHSATVYNNPFYYNSIGALVDKVYSYGIMDCKKKVLIIGNEIFVRPDEIVVFRSGFEFGSYVVDMSPPNSLRFEILNAVCNKSI